MQKKIKIIVDTSVWISYLIGKTTNTMLKEILCNFNIEIIICNKLKEEIFETANRAKFNKYFDSDTLNKFYDFIEHNTKNTNIISKIEICRDTNDNFLLELAIDSKADFLITSDDDLLSISKINKTIIINRRFNFQMQQFKKNNVAFRC